MVVNANYFDNSTICHYRKEKSMAEAKRRSKVTKFTHNTEYLQVPLPAQKRLVDMLMGARSDEWSCKNDNGATPPDGSTVIVRQSSSNELEVLDGNQIVGAIVDGLSGELYEANACSGVDNFFVATVVSHDDVSCTFAIRIHASN